MLHRDCHVLFPDKALADLIHVTGRPSVPPRLVAVVTVIQRFLGLSDREAVSAFQFDARCKYACGGLDFDYPGFAHRAGRHALKAGPIGLCVDPGIVAQSSRSWISTGIHRQTGLPKTLQSKRTRSVDITCRQV